MTVIVSKPAVNLREELASLRNQGGYEEQQFWFDSLVTNGTFDSSTAGWTGTATTLSVSSGNLRITNTGTNGYASQSFTTTSGKHYKVKIEANGGDATTLWLRANDNASRDSGTSAYTNNSIGVSDGEVVGYFTATASTSYVHATANGVAAKYADVDNISVFEVDANNDIIHRLPKGWVPKDVYEDGLLQREGSAHDYEVVYDGFEYYVKPTVAPTATTQTCVIGVRK